MTQLQFIEALRSLAEKSPYPDLKLVRRQEFIDTFGKADEEELYKPHKYDTWYRLHYRTKNATVVVNFVDKAAPPDGTADDGWVKVWLPDEKADRRAETELGDPMIYVRARRAAEYYKKNEAAIISAMSKGDALAIGGRYKQAIAAYRQAIAIVRRGPSLQGELTTALRRAEDKVSQTRSKWAQATDSKARRIAEAAEKAFDDGELDDAETQYRSLIEFIEESEVQTPFVQNSAKSAGDALKRIAEIRRRQQRQAELKRQAEQHRRAELVLLHAWDNPYEVVLKIYDEFNTRDANHLARTTHLTEALSATCAELRQVVPTDKHEQMWHSLDEMCTAVGTYCEKLRRLNERISAGDRVAIRMAGASRKLYRKEAQDDLVAFLYDYVTAMKVAGQSVAIRSETLRESLAAERIRRLQCPKCIGRGKLWCGDCRDRGRPTGKVVCSRCSGKRYVICPSCGGDSGSTCSSCGGRGKVYSHTVTGRHIRKKVYRECGTCGGKRMTWRKRGSGSQPGKCPMCARHPGKAKCPVCGGSGWAGVCPTCEGNKQITCTECNGTGKKPAAVSASAQMPIASN